VRYGQFDLCTFWLTFWLTFWKKHYFWNLMGPNPTNLGMVIPMVYSESGNNAFSRRLIFRADFWGWIFWTFCFIAAVEHGTRIPEWYGTCQSDLLWRSYGWMKFIYFGLHPLIAHALGVQWPSALCFWNTLWGAYNVVHLFILFNGVSIWSNMFRVWV
jgi:hypothetical protein